MNDRIDHIIDETNLVSEGYQDIPEIRETRDKAIELVKELRTLLLRKSGITEKDKLREGNIQIKWLFPFNLEHLKFIYSLLLYFIS